jgi:drug/metabolite transporter (DMT)-like permease
MLTPQANQRGILLMVAGTAVFAANDACSKLAAAHMPASQILAVRGLMAALMLAIILGLRGQLTGVRHVADKRVLLRSSAEAVSAFLYITALGFIGLADASAIMQVSPLVTMAAAVLFLGTRIGGKRWLAVAAGFIGVLLVVKPGAGTFQAAALLPVVSTFLISFRDFVTGRIAAHVPTLIVTLVTACFGMMAGLVGSGFEAWQSLDLAAYAILFLGAVTLICGHMLVISAFRAAHPSVVAPFRYANVPFAVAYGAWLFDMRPDAIALAGMALIIAAGVYTVRNQRREGRRAVEAALPGPAE